MYMASQEHFISLREWFKYTLPLHTFDKILKEKGKIQCAYQPVHHSKLVPLTASMTSWIMK